MKKLKRRLKELPSQISKARRQKIIGWHRQKKIA